MSQFIFNSKAPYTSYLNWLMSAKDPVENYQRLQSIVQQNIATSLKDLSQKSMAECFVSVENKTTSMINSFFDEKLDNELQFIEPNPFNSRKEGVKVKYEFVKDLRNYKVRFSNSNNFFEHVNPVFCEGTVGESNLYYIFVLSKVILEGIETKNLLFCESEVNGIFTGYFAKQFADPTIPKGHGGNKNEDPFDEKFVDVIGGCFDADIPLENGVARWEIPVTVKSKNGQKPIKMKVVQEYRLENGEFIVLKGGFELCRLNLASLLA